MDDNEWRIFWYLSRVFEEDRLSDHWLNVIPVNWRDRRDDILHLIIKSAVESTNIGRWTGQFRWDSYRTSWTSLAPKYAIGRYESNLSSMIEQIRPWVFFFSLVVYIYIDGRKYVEIVTIKNMEDCKKDMSGDESDYQDIILIVNFDIYFDTVSFFFFKEIIFRDWWFDQHWLSSASRTTIVTMTRSSVYLILFIICRLGHKDIILMNHSVRFWYNVKRKHIKISITFSYDSVDQFESEISMTWS